MPPAPRSDLPCGGLDLGGTKIEARLFSPGLDLLDTRRIPTPTGGIYAGIPMDQVMEHITEEEIMRFLGYVHNFPRGYVGKSFRITESFAGWVVSGTPDD